MIYKTTNIQTKKLRMLMLCMHYPQTASINLVWMNVSYTTQISLCSFIHLMVVVVTSDVCTCMAFTFLSSHLFILNLYKSKIFMVFEICIPVYWPWMTYQIPFECIILPHEQCILFICRILIIQLTQSLTVLDIIETEMPNLNTKSHFECNKIHLVSYEITCIFFSWSEPLEILDLSYLPLSLSISNKADEKIDIHFSKRDKCVVDLVILSIFYSYHFYEF